MKIEGARAHRPCGAAQRNPESGVQALFGLVRPGMAAFPPRGPGRTARLGMTAVPPQNFPVSRNTSKVARMWSATALTGALASGATTMARL